MEAANSERALPSPSVGTTERKEETEEEDPFAVFDGESDDDDDCDDEHNLDEEHDSTVLHKNDDANGTTTAAVSSSENESINQHVRDNESCGVLSFHAGTEMALLQHVRRQQQQQQHQRQEDRSNQILTTPPDNNNNSFDAAIDEQTTIIRRADSVLTSIDNFCVERHWMMHIGQEKAAILEKFVFQCVEAKFLHHPQFKDREPPFICVELGTYCGYSSIWFARCLLTKFRTMGWRKDLQMDDQPSPWFKIYTVEVVEEHAKIAREMIRLAGMEQYIESIVFDPNPYTTSLPEIVKTKITNISGEPSSTGSVHSANDIDSSFGNNTCINFLFLDHDKSRYLSDLQEFESSGLVRKGCYVAADNVVFASIDDYRHYMHQLSLKGVVSSKLVDTMVEYSEPEITECQSETDQQTKREQLKDGVELTIYEQDPPSILSSSSPPSKPITAIILPVLPHAVNKSQQHTNTNRRRPTSKKKPSSIKGPSGGSGGGRTTIVSVEAPIPFRSMSSKSFNQPAWFALLMGTILILHTPAWLLLIHNQSSDDDDDDIDAVNSRSMVWNILRSSFNILSWLVLDVTPKFASTFLCFFLGGMFLYMSWSEWKEGSTERNHGNNKNSNEI